MDDLLPLTLQILTEEVRANPPRTQEEACLISARYAMAIGLRPQTTQELMWAARGQAKGLFGPAFEAAGEAQQLEWIDMCERALRQAMEERAP